MTTETGMPDISFTGSDKVQQTAGRIFQVMRARGMFMSDDAKISVPTADLLAFFADISNLGADEVMDAIAANPAVFLIEQTADGTDVITTTRVGKVPGPAYDIEAHNLSQRFMTPEPKPVTPPRPPRERIRMAPEWKTFTPPSAEEGNAETEGFLLSEPEEPVAMSPEPELVAEPEPVAEEPVAAEPEVAPTPDVEEEPVTTEAVPEPEVEEPMVAEAEVAPKADAEEPVAAEPVPEPAPAIVAPEPATPLRQMAEPTDVADYSDDEIASAIYDALQNHPHVAVFADNWLTDDRAHRLSRGDVRRIRDYIVEQEQPLTDETLVQDVLGVRHTSPDYQSAVFGLNYGLSREKEFEFVGTNDQRFWSTTNLPAIGTNLRKPNDIGTDYRFLNDAPAEPRRSVDAVHHVVSFYEYQLGVLPLDADLQKLLPAAIVPDQRSTVFTFEIPKTFVTYLVELRHPTPTRGGFMLGLDDFYFNSLVPGAVITISATENDGHYTIDFITGSEQNEKLLELEEKRNPRYQFMDIGYNCEVDADWLLNETRFPNLAGEKPLADRLRRRADAVVEATFQRVGENDGDGGLLAAFEDLLAVANIERPMTADYLRETLAQMDAVSGDDANGYTYAPAS